MGALEHRLCHCVDTIGILLASNFASLPMKDGSFSQHYVSGRSLPTASTNFKNVEVLRSLPNDGKLVPVS